MADLQPHLLVDCARSLGLTIAELKSIAATAARRYYVWEVDKRSGGKRTICHPAAELKIVQEYFLAHVLHVLPIHSAATAYVKGSSIKRNALAHAASRVLLKVDFLNFFNSLKSQNWINYAAEHFPNWTKEEVEFSTRILFWGNNSYVPTCLAVGAPTSPLLSNALMFEVDVLMAKYAARNGLIYTRYADDITVSSQGKINKTAVVRELRRVLSASKYSKMRINHKKTALISSRFAMRVTGLIITPDHKISLGRSRKRLISSMVHRQVCGKLSPSERSKLRGLIAFAQDVEPSFVLMLRRKYSNELIEGLLEWGAEFVS